VARVGGFVLNVGRRLIRASARVPARRPIVVNVTRKPSAKRRPRVSQRLKPTPTVWYFEGSGGNSSVVECDLAKVEVAGSNPVSRSNNSSRRGT
jgi:hypothetical protein